MAKNTNSSVFRKVDVDQFCEDNFQDDLADPSTGGGGDRPSSACVDNEIFTRLESMREEVKTLLASGQLIQSLHIVLRDPPVKCKEQLLKDMACNCVLQVLMSFKGSEKIEEAVNSLDKDLVDTLMKYIYRGFELPGSENVSCAVLLVWHEKALAKGGLGSIIRVMTDRKKV